MAGFSDRDECLHSLVNDLDARNFDTGNPHVESHHRQSFGFDFADLGTTESFRIASFARIVVAVEKSWPDQSITVTIRAHQQDGSANSVQVDRFEVAIVVEMPTTCICPRIEIETRSTRRANTIGLNDVGSRRHETRNEIRRVCNDIGIEPENPFLIAQCGEQQMVATECQDPSTLQLNRRIPSRNSIRDVVPEITFEDAGLDSDSTKSIECPIEGVDRSIGAVTCQDCDGQTAPGSIESENSIHVSFGEAGCILDRREDHHRLVDRVRTVRRRST